MIVVNNCMSSKTTTDCREFVGASKEAKPGTGVMCDRKCWARITPTKLQAKKPEEKVQMCKNNKIVEYVCNNRSNKGGECISTQSFCPLDCVPCPYRIMDLVARPIIESPPTFRRNSRGRLVRT